MSSSTVQHIANSLTEFPILNLRKQPKKWSLAAIKNGLSKAVAKTTCALTGGCLSPSTEATQKAKISNDKNYKLSITLNDISLNSCTDSVIQIKHSDHNITEKLLQETVITM